MDSGNTRERRALRALQQNTTLQSADPPAQVTDVVPATNKENAVAVTGKRRVSFTPPAELDKLNEKLSSLSQTFQVMNGQSASQKPGWNNSTRAKTARNPIAGSKPSTRSSRLPPIPSFSSSTPAPTTAKLEQLTKPSTSQPLFDFPHDCSLMQSYTAAKELFENPEFLMRCMSSLDHELQRTRDGATKDSRIKELAGLTKTLRNLLRQLGSKVSEYVRTRTEQEADFINKVKEQDSTLEELQNKLDTAQRAISDGEFNQKMSEGHFKSRIEVLEIEGERLQRALEHSKLELASAQEKMHRCEAEKGTVTTKMLDLQHEMKQVTLQLKQSINQQEILKADLTRSQTHVAELQVELKSLQAAHQGVQQEYDTKRANETQLMSELEKFRNECLDAKRCAANYSDRVAGLEGETISLQGQLQRANNELAIEKRAVERVQQELEDLKQLHAENSEAWEQQKDKLQGIKSQLEQQVRELQAEVGRLQAELTQSEGNGSRMSSELESLTMKMEELQQRHQELQELEQGTARQLEEKKSELESVVGQLGTIREESAGQQQQIEELEAELQDKSARLSHLEGEFDVLREVIGEGEQQDVVGRLLSKISTLQQAAAEAEQLRRRLHNEIIEMRGNIRVFCRVRPYNGVDTSVRCLQDGVSLKLDVDGKEHAFKYDQVFNMNANQERVFSSVSELVQSALDGYHVCLFSYGQTGAGKTYTMQGTRDSAGRGIIPRSVEKILETAKKMESQEWEYHFEASFIEIYNNTLRDLLAPPGAKDHGKITDQNAIKHDPNGGHTTVVGASRWEVPDVHTAVQLVDKAAAARACEATKMNEVSSRSHSVFMLYITGKHPVTSTTLQGCLCLVDLAGSERLDRSGAEAERKKEACSINQSLSSLGDIFAALSSKQTHIPYRNSKLTYLLQPCLGGSGKTLMFVNINPEPQSASETLQSLKFAAKVNGCETAAKGGAKRNVTAPGGATAALPERRASLAPAATPRRSLVATGRPSLSQPPSARRASMAPSITGTKRPNPSTQGNEPTGPKRVKL